MGLFPMNVGGGGTTPCFAVESMRVMSGTLNWGQAYLQGRIIGGSTMTLSFANPGFAVYAYVSINGGANTTYTPGTYNIPVSDGDLVLIHYQLQTNQTDSKLNISVS